MPFRVFHKCLDPAIVLKGHLILGLFVCVEGVPQLRVALEGSPQSVRRRHVHRAGVLLVLIQEIVAVHEADDLDVSMYLDGHLVALVLQAADMAAVPHAIEVVIVNENALLGQKLRAERLRVGLHLAVAPLDLMPAHSHLSFTII